MDVQLLVCGYCDGKEHHVLKGGRRKTIKFPALTALIKHPEKGYILFDTGYSNRFYEETKKWPGKIYAFMTPTHVKEEEYLVNQLAKKGIQAEEIKYVIISHFHGDHICGMKDFPNAQFICSQEAFDNVQKVKDKAWKAIFQGVLPGLLPEDFADRAWTYENKGLKVEEDDILGTCHDLFADGLIKTIPLPGHHYGQIGLLLQTKKGPLLLAADACWLGQAYKENRMPSSISKLLLSDWNAFKESLNKLHLFYKEYPEVAIIPTHCEATQAEYSEFFEEIT